jgi:hypothetical protein
MLRALQRHCCLTHPSKTAPSFISYTTCHRVLSTSTASSVRPIPNNTLALPRVQRLEPRFFTSTSLRRALQNDKQQAKDALSNETTSAVAAPKPSSDWKDAKRLFVLAKPEARSITGKKRGEKVEQETVLTLLSTI